MSVFSLFDVETANLVDCWDTEGEAMAALRSGILAEPKLRGYALFEEVSGFEEMSGRLRVVFSI